MPRAHESPTQPVPLHVAAGPGANQHRMRAPLVVVLLLSMVAVLILPAAPAVAQSAGSWPVWGQDAGNTRQASVAGPTNPGLRWAVDLASIRTDAAPQGYDMAGTRGVFDPILDAAGNVVQSASNPATGGRAALVALDAADGQVAWEVQELIDSCGPAVDAQGRLWTQRRFDANPQVQVNHLQAFTSQGVAIDDAVFELTALGTGGRESWCPLSTSLHVVGPQDRQRLILFRRDRNDWSIAALDITGAQPEVAWSTDDDSVTLPGQVVSGAVGGDDGATSPLLAAASDDELLVVLFADGALSLAGLNLDTGALVRQVAIPVRNLDGEQIAVDNARIGAQVLVSGRWAVVAISDRGSVQGRLYGIDLQATSASPTWERGLPSEGGVTISGPAVLALSGSTVVAESLGSLHGVALSTGELAAFSGQPQARADTLLTDATGAIYVSELAGPGAQNLVRYDAQGRRDWQLRRTTLTVDGAPATTDNLTPAAIGADGLLVTRVGGQLFGIDNSGGLADCELPFEDIAETNVHAENICELVQRGITSGVTATTYVPGGQVTRAQMASFLARALSLDPITAPGPALAFPDVDAGNVHAGNIHAIRQAGITQGRADGTYDPNGTVTRAEMASFLARAADLTPVPGGGGFTDVDPTNVHAPSIGAVREAGITTGLTSTRFAPNDPVRRDQMASFLIRMVNVREAGGASSG